MTKFKDNSKKYEKPFSAASKLSEDLNKKIEKISNLRLVLFLMGLIFGITAFSTHIFPIFWSLLPFAFFIIAILFHNKFYRERENINLIKDFFEEGLCRINEDWAGKGNTNKNYTSEHLYAEDLDIFGKGSLFENICTAKTRAGEEKLAKWLLYPDSAANIIDRQMAVKELTDDIELRKNLYLITRKMNSIVNPQKLQQWSKAPPVFNSENPILWRILFSFMGILSIIAIASMFYSDFGLAFLAAVAIIEWSIGRIYKKHLDKIVSGLDGPRRELKKLSDILMNFENREFSSSLLVKLKKDLLKPIKSSTAIRDLGRLVDILDQAKNQAFAPLAFLLMWTPHLSILIEKWRIKSGENISSWLDAAGEIEALCSLAGYAFEHPDDIFPEITDEGPVFKGKALGHPLIKSSACIRNDVNLDSENSVLIVSGSNMSGKSTYLRTIGINGAIAMAGAPVRAESLKISPLYIGATIRIEDSLQKGASRFYAEISTLKEIVDLTQKEYPLLFLLDEIFHGTNSHDRKIGAEAIIKQLVKSGSIGLVTTHDLTLADMTDQIGTKSKNIHFDDEVSEGVLNFDYKVKNGPVTKSNAIELMRSVGLVVD